MSVIRRRHLPTEVDTIQWLGDNEAEVQEFTGPGVFRAIPAAERVSTPEITASVYDKLHATWIGVYTGQHIVRGIEGELYPIAEDVLGRTYEIAEDGGDFFQVGHTYSDDEYAWKFRVDTITTHPQDGARIALGWRLFNGRWEEMAYGEDDWEIHQVIDHIDATEAGEPA